MNHIRTESDTKIAIELPEVNHGDRVSISYNGVLNTKGSDEVYLHYGFDGWKNTSTVPMHRKGDGTFITDIRVNGGHEVNLCFKDDTNNWDNNNGVDWKVNIR